MRQASLRWHRERELKVRLAYEQAATAPAGRRVEALAGFGVQHLNRWPAVVASEPQEGEPLLEVPWASVLDAAGPPAADVTRWATTCCQSAAAG